jgi:hypothetical protein
MECGWDHAPVAGPVAGWVGRPAGREIELGWGGYAKYQLDLHDGSARSSITLDGATATDASLALMLTVLPIVLPLIDLEPLHGSAMGLPQGGAALLLGRSGVGKSTTAAILEDERLVRLSDDVSAVDEELRVWSGPPLFAPLRDAQDVGWGRYDGKMVVPMKDARVRALPVRAVVVLDPAKGGTLNTSRSRGFEAVRRVLENVRSPTRLVERRQKLQLHVASELARTDVAVVSFDREHHPPTAVAQAIADLFRSRGIA